MKNIQTKINKNDHSIKVSLDTKVDIDNYANMLNTIGDGEDFKKIQNWWGFRIIAQELINQYGGKEALIEKINKL